MAPLPPHYAVSDPATSPPAAPSATPRILQALQVLTDAALSHVGLNDLLHELLQRLITVMSADNAAILLTTEGGHDMIVYTALGPEEAVVDLVRIPIGQGVGGRIAATRQPLVVPDLHAVEVANSLLREKFRSLVGVPLIVGDRLVGVMHVDSVEPDHFSQEDVRLLQLAADRIALAIEHARAYALAQQAQDRAEARTAQLEAVLEAITDGVGIYDTHGNLVQANTALRRLIGIDADPRYATLPPGERAAQTHVTTLDGRPMAPDQYGITRLLNGETVTSDQAIAITIRALDGHERYLNITGAPLRDAEQRIVGAVAVSHNVTEQYRLERELAEKASELEATIDAIADGVLVFGEGGRVLRTNAAAREFLMLTDPPEAYARPLSERGYRTVVFDEQGAPLSQAQWPMFRVLAGEVLTGAQATYLRVRTPDMRELDFSMTGAPVRDATGRVVAAVCVCRDVTERQQQERRTREALNALLAMAQALVEAPTQTPSATQDARLDERRLAKRVVELTQRLLSCGRVGLSGIEADTGRLQPVAVAGLPPEAEQWWFAETPHHSVSEYLSSAALEKLRHGEVVLNASELPLREGEPPLPAQSVLTAPLMLADRLIGILTYDFGRTPHNFLAEELALAGALGRLAALALERERLLRERAEAEASAMALRAANRRMDEFLGIASHELKTPLAAIQSSVQLLIRRFRRADANTLAVEELARLVSSTQPVLANMDKSARRQARLVDEMLDVSRIQTGRLEFQVELCDLASIVRDMVEEHQQLHPARTLTLSTPGGTVPVIADTDRISQVITNYLTNALKYSLAERPVNVRLQFLDDTYARVSIQDSGPGLPASERDRIWDLFYRAPGVDVLSGSGVGLGLGLHICKTIIERHGGQVGVESTVGEGSTFWFTLPLASSGSKAITT